MSDDPFGPPKPTDRPAAGAVQGTILKPAPGGRGPANPPPNFQTPPAGGGMDDAGFSGLGSVDETGANPILSAGTQLLALAGQLRRSSHYDDVDGLFRRLCQEVRAFDAELKSEAIPPDSVSIASYTLCGFLDEAILNTPWGSESGWGNRTLLAEFHNEVDAGEQVFAILDRIKPDPGRYLHLLELIYVCISLGFQGKYRRQERGFDDLERLREELSLTINRQRGPYERELSARWQGAQALRPKFTRFLPVWVLAATCGLLLLVAFGGMLRWLYTESDPVMREVTEMGRYLDPVVAERLDLAPPVRQQTLVSAIGDSLEEGVLEPGQHANVVVLRNLFNSGSTAINENSPVLNKVAVALGSLRGKIRITGHTDNVPIRTLRFPSNWELSEGRAQAVRQHLEDQGLPSSSMVAEARADTEPVCVDCGQNSAAERAQNRRVEIELVPGAKRQ